MTLKKIHIKKDPSTLEPYPFNARRHSKDDIKKLAKYIQNVGYINPVIIDEKNMILAGHKRALACMEAGLKNIDCFVIEGLTDDQKKAYIIADNQFTLVGKWDEDLLKQELNDLMIEINLNPLEIGFDMKTLKKLDIQLDMDSGSPKKEEVLEPDEEFIVIVEASNEDEQSKLYEEFTKRGLSCKII